jgi:hypothetical protein
MPFAGTEYGVMFEDDGDTGYLYAANEKFDRIFDALHLYNSSSPRHDELRRGDQFFVVWNPVLQKAGIYYHDQFQAVIDFRNRLACCRTGFPAPMKGDDLWNTPHMWDEKMTHGLGHR